MRITARQLRQIIKEELTRSLRMNEADLFTQADLDAEFDADIDRRMRQMDTPNPLADYDPDEVERSSAAVSMTPRVSDTRSPIATDTFFRSIDTFLPSHQQIARDVYTRGGSALVAKLNDIVKGNKVLQIGSRGDDVLIYQMAVMAALNEFQQTHTGTKPDMTLDYMEIAKKAMADNAGNITPSEIMGAIKDLFATREASYPDGNYGPGTAAAVAIFQTIMDNKQIHGLFGTGRDIPVWDALIDGKIGRQTAQALAGLGKLAMPTVSNPANARKAFIRENKSSRIRK